VAKADGSRYVLHEARHTTATLLRNAGVDPSVIVDIMGHTDAATSRGYMHSDHTARLAALDAVAARLGLD
jgi:integrase